jgi:hypothetical protein
MFQLEVIDSETAEKHIEEEEQRKLEADSNASPRSWGQNESTISFQDIGIDEESIVITQDRLPAEGSQEEDIVGDGTGSLLHRILKHKNLNVRTKQMMGLEPHRPYMARVRCHNSFGYSHWSEWCGPIIPQPGVYVLDYNQEQCSVRIGWFKPMLKGLKKDISTAVDKLTDDNIDYRLSNNIPIKTFDKKKNQLEISINNKNEVCLVKNNVLVCVDEDSFKVKDKT